MINVNKDQVHSNYNNIKVFRLLGNLYVIYQTEPQIIQFYDSYKIILEFSNLLLFKYLCE